MYINDPVTQCVVFERNNQVNNSQGGFVRGNNLFSLGGVINYNHLTSLWDLVNKPPLQHRLFPNNSLHDYYYF